MREPPRYSAALAVKLLEDLPPPDEIRAAIETLETCANVSAPGPYTEAIEALKVLLDQVERASDSLLLASRGERDALRIEVDPETKQAKLRQVGKPGRPTDYHNELIANVAEAIAMRLEQETEEPAKPRQVCEEVARTYHPLFPPGYLDASPRGNIYNIWKMRERKRQEIIQQIEALAPSEAAVEQLIRRSGLPVALDVWRSRWIRYLEELRDLAEWEAAGGAPQSGKDL